MLIHSIRDYFFCVFFFKQKTAYEMRISDWSSDVCSSDLVVCLRNGLEFALRRVAPGVIGTYEAARCTAGLCDQRRATMLANITESANFVVRATTDDDRKSQLLKQLVRTLLGQFAQDRKSVV